MQLTGYELKPTLKASMKLLLTTNNKQKNFLSSYILTKRGFCKILNKLLKA